MRQAVRLLWEYVRTVTGDNAYEHYLADHAVTHRAAAPLSRREFFARVTHQKWSGINRCC